MSGEEFAAVSLQGFSYANGIPLAAPYGQNSCMECQATALS